MRSIERLNALRELPEHSGPGANSTKERLQALIKSERLLYSAEYTSAASFGLWSIFDSVNVNDRLAEAYAAAYPNPAADHSLYQQYQDMMERGPQSVERFIDSLKGLVASPVASARF